MNAVLFHIYGDFAINSYGLMIAIGLIIGLYFLHKKIVVNKLLSENQFNTLFQISFFSGLAGGRIWYLLTNWHEIDYFLEIFQIWKGGLSIQGCIIAILIVAPWYLYTQQAPIFPVLDQVAIYTPLTQSIARLGCLFAGCCHGIATSVPWAIIYTDPESLAPLHIALHPTQLYSSILLFISFLLLRWISSRYTTQPGIILSLYIMLVSSERFIVDFWRNDQDFYFNYGFLQYFSIQQLLAILMFVGAIFMIVIIKNVKKIHEFIYLYQK
jgi:phosphatidylglycerol:prolipoprotein diacylglycerol transferase